MSSRPWYKRYPSDFIAGTLSLTAEEKGVYGVLLDLMYDRHAPIVDDARELGRISGCSTRRFKQVRDKLAGIGKIILRDGLISNARFEKQILNEEKEHENLSKNGEKGAEKTNAPKENKDIPENRPRSVKPPYQIPDTRKKDNMRSASAREPDGFSDWYAIYPRKKARKAAAKAFAKVIAANEISIGSLLDQTKAFAAAWSRGGKKIEFCPYPASWLNSGEYLDAPELSAESADAAKIAVPLSGPANFTPSEWRDCLKTLRRDGSWLGHWGPRPGEAGCLVPREMLLGEGKPMAAPLPQRESEIQYRRAWNA